MRTSFKVTFAGSEFPALYITDRDMAIRAIAKLLEYSGVLGVDTETMAYPQYKHIAKAGLSPHLARIRLLQIFNDKASVVFDLLKINDDSIFIHLLSSRKFIAHNAVFDLGFFRKMGVKRMDIHCSLIMSRMLLHATRPFDTSGAGLDAMVMGMFGVDLSKTVQASDWGNPDLTFEQIEYAALDAVAVKLLGTKLAGYLTKYGLEKYYRMCKRAQQPMSSLQLNGCMLDAQYHDNMLELWGKRFHLARNAVTAVTGIQKITAYTIADWLERNLPEEVLLVWPRTDEEDIESKLKTDAHTFADFSDFPIVKPFSEYQKQDKLLTAFGDALLNMINPATGRIHANFTLCGARTGRMSCSTPNLQQAPSDKEFRTSFIAAPGYRIALADYNQIELRIAAELSRDETMLNAYRTGMDLHSLTASKVSNKPITSVTGKDRKLAKAINFGFLFGLGAAKFSHYAKKGYEVEVTNEQAKIIIQTFRDTYPGYYAWQMEQARNAKETLYCKTPSGKLRKLSIDNTYGSAMNQPVQGGAAECNIVASALIQEEIEKRDLDCKLILNVHDELAIEFPETMDAAIPSDLLSRNMLAGFLDIFPNGITRGVVGNVGIGVNWALAKEDTDRKRA